MVAHTFKYWSKQNPTELPNFIWDHKKKNIDISLEWVILDKAKQYSPGSKNCMLFLSKKHHILFSWFNVSCLEYDTEYDLKHEMREIFTFSKYVFYHDYHIMTYHTWHVPEEWHWSIQPCAGLLAAKQVPAKIEQAVYIWSTSF